MLGTIAGGRLGSRRRNRPAVRSEGPGPPRVTGAGGAALRSAAAGGPPRPRPRFPAPLCVFARGPRAARPLGLRPATASEALGGMYPR